MVETTLPVEQMEVEREPQDGVVIRDVDADEKEEKKDFDSSLCSFTFKMEDFANIQQERLISDCFPCRSINFQILVFPRGNSQKSNRYGPTHISVYVAINEEEIKKCRGEIHVYAEYQIVIVNHKDETKSHVRKRNHQFCQEVSNQGCLQFFQLDKLTKEDGFMAEDGSVHLRVDMEIKNVSTKRRYGSYDPSYDSRDSTGFVGLKNQGATSYMNSFLQTLYNIPFFRKAVYSLPTESLKDIEPTINSYVSPPAKKARREEAEKSLPLALQRVFYQLQTSDKSVETKKLTKAFGWKSADAYQQPDVQKFSRVLCDALEKQMARTDAKDTFSHMFEAKYEMFVECTDVDYRSSRIETYHDLSLTVKGHTNICDSMKQFVESETLDGDNKYRAGKHGMQKAEKGIKFLSFPPILQLQLKRFEYDPQSGFMQKVNDKFEYPLTLDLNSFIRKMKESGTEENAKDNEKDDDVKMAKDDDKNSSSPPKSNGVKGGDTSDMEDETHPKKKMKAKDMPDAVKDDYTYKLHSVLVHSGDVYGDHYEAYIRPEASGDKWFKFDDDCVDGVGQRSALDDNFGDFQYYGQTHRNNSSAYMLVYVQKNKVAKFLSPMTKDDIPKHLEERFTREVRQRQEAREREEDEKKKKPIKILVDDKLKTHHGIGLEDGRQAIEFKVYKTSCLNDFKKDAAKAFGIPEEEQFYWTYTKRQNETYRANKYVKETDMANSFMKFQKTQFYLKRSSELLANHQHEFESNEMILIFFKLYDREKGDLRFIDTYVFKNSTKLADVKKRFCEVMKYPEDMEMVMHEEEHAEQKKINLLDPLKTLQEVNLINGDIICFEKKRVWETDNTTTYVRETVWEDSETETDESALETDVEIDESSPNSNSTQALSDVERDAGSPPRAERDESKSALASSSLAAASNADEEKASSIPTAQSEPSNDVEMKDSVATESSTNEGTNTGERPSTSSRPRRRQSKKLAPVADPFVFPKSTTVSEHLEYLMKNRIGEKGEHICEECGDVFSRSSTMQRHTNSEHKKLKKYVCDVCNDEILLVHKKNMAWVFYIPRDLTQKIFSFLTFEELFWTQRISSNFKNEVEERFRRNSLLKITLSEKHLKQDPHPDFYDTTQLFAHLMKNLVKVLNLEKLTHFELVYPKKTKEFDFVKIAPVQQSSDILCTILSRSKNLVSLKIQKNLEFGRTLFRDRTMACAGSLQHLQADRIVPSSDIQPLNNLKSLKVRVSTGTDLTFFKNKMNGLEHIEISVLILNATTGLERIFPLRESFKNIKSFVIRIAVQDDDESRLEYIISKYKRCGWLNDVRIDNEIDDFGDWNEYIG